MSIEEVIDFLKSKKKLYSKMDESGRKDYVMECLDTAINLLSAKTDGDLISRQAVIDNIKTRLWQTALNNDEYITSYAKVCEDIADNRIDTWVNEVPSAKMKGEEEE